VGEKAIITSSGPKIGSTRVRCPGTEVGSKGGVRNWGGRARGHKRKKRREVSFETLLAAGCTKRDRKGEHGTEERTKEISKKSLGGSQTRKSLEGGGRRKAGRGFSRRRA